jgi:hypothetical protein
MARDGGKPPGTLCAKLQDQDDPHASSRFFSYRASDRSVLFGRRRRAEYTYRFLLGSGEPDADDRISGIGPGASHSAGRAAGNSESGGPTQSGSGFRFDASECGTIIAAYSLIGG